MVIMVRVYKVWCNLVTVGESEKEIADVYLNNMGAFYGSEKNWETVRQFALEAALTRTDAVIQPRQSNTWGCIKSGSCV